MPPRRALAVLADSHLIRLGPRDYFRRSGFGEKLSSEAPVRSQERFGGRLDSPMGPRPAREYTTATVATPRVGRLSIPNDRP